LWLTTKEIMQASSIILVTLVVLVLGTIVIETLAYLIGIANMFTICVAITFIVGSYITLKNLAYSLKRKR
jgi:positive regulator of sigma E activity